METIHMKHSLDAEYKPFEFQASVATYGDLAKRVGYDPAQDATLSIEVDGGRQTIVEASDSMTLVDGTYIQFFW